MNLDLYFYDFIITTEDKDSYPQDYIFRDYDLFHLPMAGLDSMQDDLRFSLCPWQEERA